MFIKMQPEPFINFMKNIFLFYLLIFIPLLMIVLGGKYHYISAGSFAWSLIIYGLVYHPLISGIRLIENKKIKRSELWLSFVPFWNWRHFSFLFFNKS
jgi:hypothetical protein